MDPGSVPVPPAVLPQRSDDHDSGATLRLQDRETTGEEARLHEPHQAVSSYGAKDQCGDRRRSPLRIY